MSWITVGGYILAGCLCIWVAARSRSSRQAEMSGNITRFWRTLGIVMLVLALNKQLDLQMWFWQTGKSIAKTYDLYHLRKLFQIASMTVLALVAVAVFVYFRRLTWGAFRECALALLGILLTLCFVIVRATSLHHVDVILGWNVGGVRFNWILENGGILLVAVAAILALRRSRPGHFVQFGDHIQHTRWRKQALSPTPVNAVSQNELPKD